MKQSDSDGLIRPVSVVVLGLLETTGPQTSYELWRNVELSVSYFWQVAKSQLYAEPQRLERAGLVTADQEDSGRRRRTYAITGAGRDALIDWLGRPPEPAQYHDPAMLRLFFTDAAPRLATPLARQRVRELTETLQFLEQPGLGGDQPSHRRVLSWGRLTVRADLAFWRSVLDDLEDGA
ncbi:DNA-binding PadR family transcriptional regulator [Propionibacteriaceae bacterium ES.041]|uniref:PadR family transcriptional regulator n=1 Tax=Enemella evansiae TaxID=2016499 RepID=UPI000B97BEA5|nr:PadR family transcriptional regulator [Enemella evansiae]OYO02257.1 PadR family transcriptional regulator [Enemella evansiae]PFG66963.1 DNA-binding PadR family transcriptional regulator [Propionibacteriaceae bacterium ES.041]TDO92827.1 DNA-binding PadR family transcriptional regulator [Enemella evansiae]